MINYKVYCINLQQQPMIKLTLYGKDINDKVNCKLIQKEVELLFNAVIDRYINETIKRKRG